jgi:hypothetical protein
LLAGLGIAGTRRGLGGDKVDLLKWAVCRNDLAEWLRKKGAFRRASRLRASAWERTIA